jgi:hypothetical protein
MILPAIDNPAITETHAVIRFLDAKKVLQKSIMNYVLLFTA